MSLSGLIPCVNQLQQIFSQLHFSPVDLPQVVAVGGQSSGKSSVIENLVGRDFLPRGTGIVTRRPLVMQLNNIPQPDAQDYAEFAHINGRRFFDFDEVRKEIENETARLCGASKGVSSEPIILSVYSPNVLDITLVDTPGLTKVPVSDQPADIGDQIYSMVEQYVSKDNCIILAITPANCDVANSDALQLARKIDPSGERTVGVVTKIDLMDAGTDCTDVLKGTTYPLKLGWVGVVNRSQKDINEKKSISKAVEYEEQFFGSSIPYLSLSCQCGVTNLAKRINTVLHHHIAACLPDIRTRILNLVAKQETDLTSLGEPPSSGDSRANKVLLLQIITDVSRDFTNALEGKSKNMPHDELYGGACVNREFLRFADDLEKIDFMTMLKKEDLRTIVTNVSGTSSSLFIPDSAFEIIASRHITKLLDPSRNCAQAVYNELSLIINCIGDGQAGPSTLIRYPQLRTKIADIIKAELHGHLDPTQRMISTQVDMELAYMNTNHPSFAEVVASLQGNTAGHNGWQKRRSLMPHHMNNHGGSNSSSSSSRSQSQSQSSTPRDQQRQQQQGNPYKENSSPTHSNKRSSPTGASKSAIATSSPTGSITGASMFNHTKEGFLNVWFQHKGLFSDSKKWKRQYVVAKAGCLMYFKDKSRSSGEPDGIIPLTTCSVQCFTDSQTSGGHDRFKIEITGAPERLLLSTDSEVDQEQWFGVLNALVNIDGSSSSSKEAPAAQVRANTSSSPEKKTLNNDMPGAAMDGGGKASGRAGSQTAVLQNMLAAYLHIVRTNISDAVPKVIMLFLVNKMKQTVQHKLIEELYSDQQVDALMQEAPGIKQARLQANEMIRVLKQADEVIGQCISYQQV